MGKIINFNGYEKKKVWERMVITLYETAPHKLALELIMGENRSDIHLEQEQLSKINHLIGEEMLKHDRYRCLTKRAN